MLKSYAVLRHKRYIYNFAHFKKKMKSVEMHNRVGSLIQLIPQIMEYAHTYSAPNL